MTLPVDLGGTISVRFFIIENLPTDTLLGNDTLQLVKAKISYSKKILKVGKQKIPVETTKKKKKSDEAHRADAVALAVARDTVIPPNLIKVSAQLCHSKAEQGIRSYEPLWSGHYGHIRRTEGQ